MTNKKLESIAVQAAGDLLGFISDKEKEVLAAWDSAAQEAQDNETKPKFKLGFTISLDLDKDHMETALKWSVNHKVSKDAPIPDPDQINLPLEEEEDVPHIKAGK